MIPEWLLFRNRIRSRMNIVLHSHVKIESLSPWSSISPCLVALDKIRMRHSPQTTLFASFNPERSVFSVYLISVYIIPKRKFHWDWRPDWTHSGMTCAGTKFFSVSCEQMQRNICRWHELVEEWKLFRFHVNSP